jgi:nucleoside-diphosphate-sugar epimerase
MGPDLRISRQRRRSSERTVSITGATGFLGWRMAEAFRDDGWRVRGIVRRGNLKPLPDGVESRQASLHDSGELARAIDGSDVIVHSAALIRAPTEAAFEAANVEGTRHVVAAANRAGVRLVHISSQAAGGPGTPVRPAREHDPPRPLNAYGRSKLASERVVRGEALVPWTIVRPSAVYGCRDRGFLPLFRLAARGVFLELADPAASFTLVNVDDVARSVLLTAVVERAAGETLFVGHPQPHRADELLRHLAEIFGRRYRALRVPPAIAALAAAAGDAVWWLGRRPLIDRGRLVELRAEGFVCDVGRAREVLGFTADVPLREGLTRTAEWYRNRGWI